MKLIKVIFISLLAAASHLAIAAPLITPKEAALPPAAGTLATRGIFRGPAIKLASPEADTPVAAPRLMSRSISRRVAMQRLIKAPLRWCT